MAWWLAIAATALALAVESGVARAAPPLVESIIVKWHSDAARDASGDLSAADRDALLTAVQAPFSIVGQTRDGALRLELLQPLPLDAARAAVNRVRLLDKVVYANIRVVEAVGNAANAAGNDRAGATFRGAIHRQVSRRRAVERGAAQRAAAGRRGRGHRKPCGPTHRAGAGNVGRRVRRPPFPDR